MWRRSTFFGRGMSLAKVLLVAALAVLLTAATQSQTSKAIPKPSPTPWTNKAPSVKLVPAIGRVTLPGCDEVATAVPGCSATSPKVKLSAQATDPDGDLLLYTYSTTGGRIDGDGPEVTLDLTGIAPGVYSVTVKVDDGNGGIVTDTTEVLVERCTCDPRLLAGIGDDCPRVVVSCQDTVTFKQSATTFTANISGGDPAVTTTFNWTVRPARSPTARAPPRLWWTSRTRSVNL